MSETTHQADVAAEWLYREHADRRAFRGIEPWPLDADEAYAYRVQDGLNALRAAGLGAIAGYKIGLTTPRMQKLCRGDRPISGVMFASNMRRSPATVRASDFVHLCFESELAVRLARPLPGKASRAEVSAAVAQVAAAFEFIEDRHADYGSLDWRAMAADNSWQAGLVLAPSIAPPDISNLTGVLEIDGDEVDRGSTADVLGHPYDAIAWLAGHLAERGRVLEAGHWISTGSIASLRFAEPGRSYRFTIAGLPPVDVRVA